MRSPRLVAIIVGIAAAFPAVASAGEVSVTEVPTVFRAFEGETNDLTVTGPPIYAVFDSLAALTVGPGCVSTSTNGANCTPEGGRNFEAYLNDKDDVARIQISGTASIWAGAGDDDVRADSFSGGTFVYGEAGDDTISAGGEGGQLADGGPGNDVVFAGGFAGHGTGIGGPGDDIITFRTNLYGPATLEGGNGNDTITSQPAGGTAAGGNGNDIIVIEGNPPFSSGDGFTITGGAGNDTITAGQFPDTVDGGDGRDYIDVLDGGADIVACGAGIDIVVYDAGDTVAADCEIRLGP